MIRKILAAAIGSTVDLLAYLIPTKRAKTLAMVKQQIRPYFSIQTKHGLLKFSPQSYESSYVFGFHSDEPDLMEFIEQIPKNACLWDIGANVGMYSVYAALRGDIQVLAFEPSVASCSTLNKNIEINGLADKVLVFPIAFARQTSLDTLNMSKNVDGDVSVQFGREVDPFDDPLEVEFRQGAVGFSIDDFADIFSPPMPTHMKIDVDGLEPEIIEGGQRVLSEYVQSILIEVLDGLSLHRRESIFKQMDGLGFTPRPKASEKFRNVIFDRR